ncbi:MAG TPA: CDP-alcohol phosphatidyltransferase family protein, partial [Acidimicrobiales bacterium]|nr:CDP-alcohol phosphatidyltransferase family protein [Acidimicrobiales bacterium]
MIGKPGDEHLRDWADLHLTQAPTGFVGGWLRAMAAIARPLARAGVSPNMVTVAAFLVAVATIPLAMIDGWMGPASACVALIASGLLDALDGAVAVQAGRTTTVGFLLDSALDRLSDVALAVALAIVADNPVAGELAVATVAATWWLEYVRARGSLAASAPTTRPTSQVVTPGERPTRMILTGVGLGLPFLALAALWGQVVIVGGSALFLFGWSVRR